MPLSKKLTFWFEHFYPGLLASISALGAGDFSDSGDFRLRMQGDDAIYDIRLGLVYALHDRHVISITERLALKAGLPAHRFRTQTPQLGDWEAYYYALRYKNAGGENIIGFDLHELTDDATGVSRGNLHHVHFDTHRPPEKHTLAEEFEPNPSNMDPRQFIARVGDYRRARKFPVSKKKKP